MALDDTSPIEDAMKRIVGNPAAKAASGDVQLTAPPSLIAYAPGAFDWKKQAGMTVKTTQTPVAAPVASAPVTATDPSASLYSWTTPRERDAAQAAAAQGVDYWGTTSPESRAAAFKSQDAYDAYKYKGNEWNDPLAQQVYKQFSPSAGYSYGGKGTEFDTDLRRANDRTSAGGYFGTMGTSLNPTGWGSDSQYSSSIYNQMKAEYLKQGGLAYGAKSPYTS